MRTLLVITRHPTFAQAIETSLDAALYRVIQKEDAVSAGALLARGAIDAVVLDIEHITGLATRAIEEVRALGPDCPLVVFAGPGPRPWEEDAYLLGAAHVLEKPVRARLLENLLARALESTPDQAAPATTPPVAPPTPYIWQFSLSWDPHTQLPTDDSSLRTAGKLRCRTR